MKEYDIIIIGSGSATNLLDPLIQENPKIRIALIDKDEPGGICLTRGCIPSKILLYPAELIRTIEEAHALGVEAEISKIDFPKIMARMRSLIDKDIDAIRRGLSNSENIDYYHEIAEFVAPYKLRLLESKLEISAKMLFLCAGSKTSIPAISGLEETGYLTSDTLLRLTILPKSIAIIGGGYIAAEFGHFLSCMGSKVIIIGRNKSFLPEEEPEISSLAQEVLGKHIQIMTNHEVVEARRTKTGKELVARDRATQGLVTVPVEEVLVAAGREPNSDILKPEKGGIRTNEKGWIVVDEHLETSQPNVWAFGDADGRYLFKHVANYESEVVYHNAILKNKKKVDYHAIPHAVFTYPEVASVGMKESEAVQKFGMDNVLVGYYKYENTAKGEAMNVKDYFVKILVKGTDLQVLGAHIIGPYASILIQEVINVMYSPSQSAEIIERAMHIHPALNEVVQRAFSSLMPVAHYREHMTGQ